MATNEAKMVENNCVQQMEEELFYAKQELQYASENDFKLELIRTKLEDTLGLFTGVNAKLSSFLTSDIDDLIADFDKAAKRFEEKLNDIESMVSDPDKVVFMQNEELNIDKDKEEEENSTIDIDDDKGDISSILEIASQGTNNESHNDSTIILD